MSSARLAARPAPRVAPHRSAPGALPAARPDLRLVGPATRRRRALTRAATALAAASTAAGLFAVVTLHVFLASGQADLDRLQHQADAESAQQGRLTVQVAELQSPERVVDLARQRLGMVPPTSVAYLPEADPSARLPPVAAGPGPTTAPVTAATTSAGPVGGRSSPSTTVAKAGATTPTTVAKARATTPTTARPSGVTTTTVGRSATGARTAPRP
ncbi:MAG: hypothetical protein ABR511_01185 [Acidimicrobiales bacterium]